MNFSTIAEDLEEINRKGLSSPHLFDVYGRLDLGSAPAWRTAEIRAYEGCARIALKAMQSMHCRSRSGTHYRMAGAILLELQSAQGCLKCSGFGVLIINELWDGVCPACLGSGLRPASISWRADACECRRTEFRDNLHPAYSVAISTIVGIRRSALQVA